MGTPDAPIDPAERDLAAAQLDNIAQANDGKPLDSWKEAVLRWHVGAVAHARAEAWIPGMAGAQDPVVEETLRRFYGHHMRLMIGRLNAQNVELQRCLTLALTCARFYAAGATDAGERALELLTALEPRASAAKAEPSHRRAITLGG